MTSLMTTAKHVLKATCGTRCRASGNLLLHYTRPTSQTSKKKEEEAAHKLMRCSLDDVLASAAADQGRFDAYMVQRKADVDASHL